MNEEPQTDSDESSRTHTPVVRPGLTDNELDRIARTAHEVNRQWCIACGDLSQPTWDNAPEWQKRSARNGVLFHYDNPTADADTSHNNWMQEKLADGWRYGPVKDPEAKTHPCIVAYSKLPLEQRVKDSLFMGVCRSLLWTL